MLVVPSARLHACDTGTVRDTAFSSVRENFWLGMVFDESDTESQNRYNTLSDWLDEHGENLNIKVEHILPNDTMYLRLRYGVTTPPEKLPITYFSGHHPATSRSICYFDWTPAPKISLLKNLKSNAVLSAINKDTADKWGTILYARGTGSNKREEVEKVVEQWQRSHAPGITMITVDRHAPENKFICAVAGITEEGEDWVGITFAKGRILTPILVGDAITTRKLDQMLNQLT
ncbi:MAG: hypothetical protein KAH38_06575, partial [Candidatus Hydrogenedentes bacterium]|nr:hypothetical protein [Candidatus Hydrogenedentota bacterium]